MSTACENLRSWCAVSRERRLREARAVILGWPHRSGADLCGPCVEVLEVTGASVSMLAGTMSQATLGATDQVAARLEELQLDLGEGPCWEAMDSGVPVLVPEVHELSLPHARPWPWPLFAAAVQDLPTGGIFAFPLRVGAINLGSLDVYRTRPGRLEPEVIRDATALADTMAWAVLQRLLSDTGEDLQGWERDYSDSRREVHQATGMVLAEVGTTPAGAFALLRARAFSQGRTVRQVAREVIERRLSFMDED